MNNILQKFYILKPWKKAVILFMVFFPIRFIFGIFSDFWSEDEQQIYLIGLKFYSTGHWPYFGPDVVYTNSQIPGALQGLLVGLPIFILHIPEAPYILLNLITFFSLFFLALYIKKCRTPDIPEWFLWTWIFTAPWALNFSTHVVNPSYVLPAAILFIVSMMETLPAFRKGFLNYYLSFFLMGFSTLWIFQLHMSWILLMPFIAFVFYRAIQNGFMKFILSLFIFATGCILVASLVIPTFIKFGLAGGSGGTASNIFLNTSNIKEIFTVLLRFLSFGSFELTRFMGSNTNVRLEYLAENIWASPFIVIVGITGVAQVAWMIIAWFRKNSFPEWKAMKFLILSAFIVTYFSFFFSVKGPSSHTFYLMFPLVMIYSFYCWQPLFDKKWIRIIAAIFLISGIVFHFTLALHNFKNKSMYKDRQKPLNAIQQKDYKIMGERRNFDRNE